MKKRPLGWTLIAVLVALTAGYWLGGRDGSSTRHSADSTAADPAAIQFWTCSMHPQIRQPGPGSCPLCGMDLIPVTDRAGGGGTDLRELTLSPAAIKLAEVQTAPVERRFVTKQVRMVGKVDFNETKLAYITAWIPGRLDRLYVDYTGVPVEKGDHMVSLYSPELLEAQEELIQAVQTADALAESDSSLLKERSRRTAQSSRDKLRLWGLSDEQIQKIEREKQPSDRLTINAPISGVVIQKSARQGMYVQEGTQIYTISDLSLLWVRLNAYESDLTWIHYGQEVEFETEAYPGEVFKGKIAFIDPMLDPLTRTVKVRVNLPNPDGRLKPEMFVRAIVRSRIASTGKVMDPGLAGKWISPMHPEIVKDNPGECDVCGMDLVSAESLGYVSADAGAEQAPLVIPASAPLITGKRAVAYVEKAPGTYEGREIELGPRASNFYLVRSGLEEGERVVIRGNFKIDSAIQILGRRSMMNPGDPESGSDPDHDPDHDHGHTHTAGAEVGQVGQVAVMEVPAAFRTQLGDAIAAYLDLQHALSHDDFPSTLKHAGMFRQKLDGIDMSRLDAPAHAAWMTHLATLRDGADAIAAASNLTLARKLFELVSNALIRTVRQFGGTDAPPLFRYHCPMAFGGRGADWIQATEGVENPYYGSKMFKCGSLEETLGVARNVEPEHHHE